MPSYVKEFVDQIHHEGEERLARELVHSVLIIQGMSGTLREPKRSGTVITDLTETLQASRLVGRVFPLVKNRHAPPGPILVGRSAESDVPIPDFSISNRHCFFVIGGKAAQIGDCGSTNGTFVDGKPLPPKQLVALQGGEKIVLGRFAFLYLKPGGFLEYLRQY
jgi:pSer/pThr/pTyr-binding forkhead associated (FHA) protein